MNDADAVRLRRLSQRLCDYTPHCSTRTPCAPRHLYDLAGRRTRVTWWDGFYVDYDRLVTGEVSKVRENGATTGVGVLATYAYDNLGNRTSLY